MSIAGVALVSFVALVGWLLLEGLLLVMMVLVDLVALVSLLGCVLVGLSFSSPAKPAFLLLLFFGYRYGMEGKEWVNNYRNFAKRKTQRGKQVGEDIISQEN